MKLSSVKLTHLVRLNDGTSTDELREELHGALEYDPGDQIIRIGDGTMLIPIGQVRRMTCVDPRPQCPECGESFDNNSALGGHRAHKHQVAGASSKNKEKK